MLRLFGQKIVFMKINFQKMFSRENFFLYLVVVVVVVVKRGSGETKVEVEVVTCWWGIDNGDGGTSRGRGDRGVVVEVR